MKHHVGKRWGLILLLTGAQLVCMFTALIGFNAWLQQKVEQTVHGRILQATRRTTAHLVEMIGLFEIDNLEPGSTGRAKLQQIVERTRLPNEGHLCIVDKHEGQVLCHPDLEKNPALAQARLGRVAPKNAVSTVSFLLPDRDGMLFVTAHDLPGLDARLLVYHRETDINEVITTFVGRVRAIGIVFVLILSLLTALITMLLIRRYENRLGAAHDRLLDANAQLEDMNQHLEEKVVDRSAAVVRSRDAVIFGMAKLAESRDHETGQHLDRISKYVEILGGHFVTQGEAPLTQQWLNTISTTATLHDIGKVGVADSILQKAGRLTDAERRAMQSHTFIGGDALIALKQRWGEDRFLITAAQIALSHHEKWDGSGYPYGLAGEDIPLPARIVAVADVYDALTSRRIYKDAMSHDEARPIILDGKASHFDPAVVDAFVKLENEFQQVARLMQG